MFGIRSTDGYRKHALMLNIKTKNRKINKMISFMNMTLSEVLTKPKPYRKMKLRTNFKDVIFLNELRHDLMYVLAYSLNKLSLYSSTNTKTLLSSLAFGLSAKSLNYFSDMTSEHIEGALRNTKLNSHKIGVITSISTSLPEFFSSLMAIIKGNTTQLMAAANFIGSNIVNPMFLFPLTFVKGISKIVKRRVTDLYIMLGTSTLASIFALDKMIDKKEGIILSGITFGYLLYQFIFGKDIEEKKEKEKGSMKRHLTGLGFGLTGLGLGGGLIVSSLDIVSKSLNLSTSLIGVSALAISTSLPELMISTTTKKKAEEKGNEKIRDRMLLTSLDTIIKSNIINMGFMGVISVLNNSIPFDRTQDLISMMVSEIAVVGALITENKYVKILCGASAVGVWIFNLMY